VGVPLCHVPARLTAAMCDRRKDGVYCPATELPEGRGRFAMYRLIENKYFETFIILMICASSLSLVRHIRYDTIRYEILF